jgi:hypothetical protein
MRNHNKQLIIVILFCISGPLYGYIGPGMGGGFIAVILGIVGSIILGLIGIIYYPIKRFFRNRKSKNK